MFKYFKRGGEMGNRDQNSDIITDLSQVNVSDSAPILNSRNFDLSQSTNSVHHDLRSNTGDDGNSYFSTSLNIINQFLNF